jgi:protein phosphatase
LRASGVTKRGTVRRTNEDCFAIDLDHHLCVIADGMGGHNAGEVAARVAVDAIVGCVRAALGRESLEWSFGFDPGISETANLLRTAVQYANVRVLETANSSDEYSGMGTTVVAALFRNHTLSLVHVGDSRGYLFVDHRLRQLTRDDSWVVAMLDRDPEADPKALRHHPMRNALTNVVGGGPVTQVHLGEQALQHGALVALTTDGVHGVLEAGVIERLLHEGTDVGQMAENLVGEALAGGSRDNCTAVVAEFLEDTGGLWSAVPDLAPASDQDPKS